METSYSVPSRLYDKIYPVNKLGLLADVVAADGISVASLLEGTGLDLHELRSPLARMSLNQLLVGYRNAVRLSGDPRLAFRIGERVRVTTFGMYGYALMSSVDYRSSWRFALQYRELIAPAVELFFREEDGFGICTIGSSRGGDIDDQLYQFVVEVLLSTIVTVLRDLIADEFVATSVKLAYGCPAHRSPSANQTLYAEMFGCPALFEQETNELVFDAAWLDTPSRRGDQITFQLVRRVCDETLGSMDLQAGTAGSVQRLLIKSLGRFPTIDGMGKKLNLSARTLRRRLTGDGTSYDALMRETRIKLSKKYLRETRMTVEGIAERVGYSDASSFRRAFRRWTGQTPAQYRTGIATGGPTARSLSR
jgi:AraC-like DNA-binding protein